MTTENLTDVTGDVMIAKAGCFVEDDETTVHLRYNNEGDMAHDAAAAIAYEQAMNQFAIAMKTYPDKEAREMTLDVLKKIMSMASIIMGLNFGYPTNNPFPEMETNDDDTDTRH